MNDPGQSAIGSVVLADLMRSMTSLIHTHICSEIESVAGVLEIVFIYDSLLMDVRATREIYAMAFNTLVAEIRIVDPDVTE